MRKIVLASHGLFAKGIKDSIEMICGKQPQIQVFSMLREDTTEVVYSGVNDIIENLTDNDVLVMISDFPGGSINTTLMSFLERNENIHLLTGLNIMMVMELVLANQEETIESIKERAVMSAKNSIRDVEKLVETEEGGNFYD